MSLERVNEALFAGAEPLVVYSKVIAKMVHKQLQEFIAFVLDNIALLFTFFRR